MAAQAKGAIGLAAMNLCIAQRVRQRGLNGQSLLLPEAEQQQLLELVRERSQIALLQYAALARVLAEPETMSPDASLTAWQMVPYLKRWARAGSGSTFGDRPTTL